MEQAHGFTSTKKKSRYVIERYSEDGNLECSRLFRLVNTGFDINRPYNFTYLSNCKQCTIIQDKKNINLVPLSMKIKIYGADWCIDCLNLKNYLESKNIGYEYIIITNNKEASDFVQEINNGKKIIPTIDVEGKVYANPNINELNKILKLN